MSTYCLPHHLEKKQESEKDRAWPSITQGKVPILQLDTSLPPWSHLPLMWTQIIPSH